MQSHEISWHILEALNAMIYLKSKPVLFEA